MSSVVFLATMLFLLAYIRPLEIVLAKKTTELVLLFHKKNNKASFHLVQYGPKKHQSVKMGVVNF